MAYNVGDIITVKVAVVNIYEDGGLECCHVGCEKDAENDDADTMVFDKEDIVGFCK